MLEQVDEIFYNLTGQRLNNTTHLKMFNILKDLETNEYVQNIFNAYLLNDGIFGQNTYFEYYEVEEEDWWDNISYAVYGTPNLWWVIAIINKVVNPFEFLNQGDAIIILKSEYIYDFLKEVKNIGEV